ncbi:MAG: molybdopterin-binding protein [Burkholderiales bacterium]
MKISARNVLAGTVKHIEDGSVNSEVIVELPGGAELVSIVTKASVARLGIKVGMKLSAVIKSSDVMLAVD